MYQIFEFLHQKARFWDIFTFQKTLKIQFWPISRENSKFLYLDHETSVKVDKKNQIN